MTKTSLPSATRWRCAVLRGALAVLLPALASAAELRAQSLLAGAVNGSVKDEAGRPVSQAEVALIAGVTGQRRARTTPRAGTFSYDLLQPGEYSVLVERFGYRPTLVRQVPVQAGARLQLGIVLKQGGPESGIDTIAYPGVSPGGARLVLQGSGSDDDFAEMTDPRRLATSTGTLLTGGEAGLGAAGLPGRLGALGLDGVTRWSPRHPRLNSAELDGIAFPTAALHGLELLPGGVDAEWPGAGGGVLSGFTVPGSRVLSGMAAASGGPDGQVGMVVLSGPIVRDTAHFSFGVAASRLTPDRPAPWPDSGSGAAIVAIASDSFTTDLSAYRTAARPVETIVSAFGRFDWVLTEAHRLSVRASAARLTADDPDAGPGPLTSIGSRLAGRDLSLALSMTSLISPKIGNELRGSVDAGNRDYAAGPFAGTLFPGDGLAAGSATLLPGTFKRTTFRLAEAIHLRLGASGSLKGGLQGTFNTFDQSYDDGRAGVFLFGDSTGLKTRTGVFRQTSGTLPVARFKTSAIALFAQTLLRPSPSVELLVGVRRESESVPVGDLRFNSAWFDATGIDNRAVPGKHAALLPRAAFSWTLGAARRWHVGALAGLFTEASDPGEFAEALSHATGVTVRRGNGTFSSWPAPPDSASAPMQGTALSLLGPDYQPPRTGQVRFGITGNLGGAILRVQGAYRHTDYLPLRRDLNLTASPTREDQYGRPLYGPLDKFGGVLAAAPGSNRRFAGFDEVLSLDPAAYSDYWSVAIDLERTVTRGLSFMAHYSYSRTTDNWFGARAAGTEAQIVPLTDSTGRSTWADGRSDFDVPHRLVLGAQARVGRARVAAVYQWRSGYPFTPGFRDGVDANGDGSARNDPAFVTDTVGGAVDVIAANSCLTSQTLRMAERNSCREPAVGTLSLRLTVGLGRAGGRPAELILDALGIAASGGDVTDHALYLVDPARPLVTDPLSGVTAVPLVANPNFGKTLVRRQLPAMLRAGIRVGF